MNRRLALVLFLLGAAAALVFLPGDAVAKNARLLDSSTIQKLQFGAPTYIGYVRSMDGGYGTNEGHIHEYVDAGSLPDGGDGISSYYAVPAFSFDPGEFLMVQCGEAMYVAPGGTMTKPASDVHSAPLLAANERFLMLLPPRTSTITVKTSDGTAGVCTVFKME